MCVRKFRVKPDTHKAAYFRHFKALCKLEQRVPVSERDRRSDETFFERGCARMVGTVTAPTFDMLTAMRRGSMCVAPGMPALLG